MSKRSRRRILLGVCGLLLAGLLVAGAAVYLKASRVPADYTPVTLTETKKEEVRQAMAQRLSDFAGLVGEIGSWDPRQGDAAAPRQGKFTISQAEINDWTAAASEKFEAGLTELGMSQPAIAFGDDRLTFYSTWDKYGKVVGVDVSLHFTPQGQMTLQLDTARIGEMPMPRQTLDQHKAEIVAKLQEHVSRIGTGGGGAGGADPMRLFNQAAGKIADAMDGKPVALDIRQEFGNVRIRGIALENGACTLEMVPLDVPPGADLAAGRPPQ